MIVLYYLSLFYCYMVSALMWIFIHFINCVKFLLPRSIRNYTIRFMPVPIMDAAQALKANPEKTEDALLKVLLTSNV